MTILVCLALVVAAETCLLVVHSLSLGRLERDLQGAWGACRMLNHDVSQLSGIVEHEATQLRRAERQLDALWHQSGLADAESEAAAIARASKAPEL